MEKTVKFINFIGLLLIWGLIKYFIDIINISLNILFLSVLIETLFVFVLSFTFALAFDRSKNIFSEKLTNNIKIAIGFTIIFFILSVLKTLYNKYFLVIIINNFLFILLGALPLIRNVFIYEETKNRELIIDISVVAFFVIFKIIFNFGSILILDFFQNGTYVQIVFIVVFIILLYSTKSVVYNIFLRGTLEYDGKDYPIFDIFRVGKSSTCDITIEDKEAGKSTFFTISASKKKWSVKPNIETYLENSLIEKSSTIESGETIKCRSNYFTVSKSKGNIIKRFLLFFFYLFVFIFGGFSLEPNSIGSDLNGQVYIENIDYYLYPNISVYITDSDIMKRFESQNSFNKNDFFVIEGEDTKVELKAVEIVERPIDIVFVLDITGSMHDEYKKIKKELINFSKNIKNSRSAIRIGIITFADRPEEMTIHQITPDIDGIISQIDNIKPESGGDYKENPYDALMSLKELSFDDNAQKVIILITDAPPHVKGDKGDKGRDFTSLTTEDITKFFSGSSFLLYIVSHERFSEYQDVINNDDRKFFDIDNYNSFSDIISDIENLIKNQIKLSFISKRRIDFYLKSVNTGIKKVIIYKDIDAKKAEKFFNKKLIKRNSFFNSIFNNF